MITAVYAYIYTTHRLWARTPTNGFRYELVPHIDIGKYQHVVRYIYKRCGWMVEMHESGYTHFSMLFVWVLLANERVKHGCCCLCAFFFFLLTYTYVLQHMESHIKIFNICTVTLFCWSQSMSCVLKRVQLIYAICVWVEYFRFLLAVVHRRRRRRRFSIFSDVV